MPGISSGKTPVIYSFKDQAGNNRVAGWIDFEFQEAYASGGVSLSVSGAVPTLSGQKDVGQYFRHIEDIIANPAPGSYNAGMYLAAVNPTTIPHNVASGYPLLQLFSVVSGTNQAASGELPGTIPLGEIADATAVSGTRVKLHIIGY